MEETYISKKNAREIILNQPSRYDMLENVKSAPPADVRPNLHGHWIEKGYVGDGNYLFECSECHSTDTQSKTVKVNYCWHCGADMREPKGEKGDT